MGELISCEGFTFRPTDVDGFFFQPAKHPDLQHATIVFFAGKAARVPDPEKRLRDLLIEKLQPRVHDEPEAPIGVGDVDDDSDNDDDLYD